MAFTKKIRRHIERQNKESEEESKHQTRLTYDRDAEIINPEFKITTNVLRVVIENLENVWEQMDNANREMKNLKKNKKEMAEIKKKTL